MSLSLLFVVAGSFISAVRSQVCVPANTCFEAVSDAFGTNSLMWTCSSGVVTEIQHEGVDDCTATVPRTETKTSTLHDGVDAHTGSGFISTDYLQGVGCPTLSASPDACTDYMVIRRYGSAGYSEPDPENLSRDIALPYQDLGDNCVNKTQLYGTFVMPKGCIELQTGSNQLFCNGTHFGWTRYDDSTCGANGGLIRDAQSDAFQVGSCGYFSDDTYCFDPPEPNCLQEWYYYFEEICGCTRECSTVYSPTASPSVSPTGAPSNDPTTGAPSLDLVCDMSITDQFPAGEQYTDYERFYTFKPLFPTPLRRKVAIATCIEDTDGNVAGYLSNTLYNTDSPTNALLFFSSSSSNDGCGNNEIGVKRTFDIDVSLVGKSFEIGLSYNESPALGGRYKLSVQCLEPEKPDELFYKTTNVTQERINAVDGSISCGARVPLDVSNDVLWLEYEVTDWAQQLLFTTCDTTGSDEYFYDREDIEYPGTDSRGHTLRIEYWDFVLRARPDGGWRTHVIGTSTSDCTNAFLSWADVYDQSYPTVSDVLKLSPGKYYVGVNTTESRAGTAVLTMFCWNNDAVALPGNTEWPTDAPTTAAPTAAPTTAAPTTAAPTTVPTTAPTRAPTLYCASYSGSISSYGQDWKLLSLSVATDLVIDACDSDYDTWLYLRNAVTGNDISNCDDCGDCGISTRTVLSVPNVPAGEYEIGIGGYSSSSGSYNVKVTCSARPTPHPTAQPTSEPTAEPTSQPTLEDQLAATIHTVTLTTDSGNPGDGSTELIMTLYWDDFQYECTNNPASGTFEYSCEAQDQSLYTKDTANPYFLKLRYNTQSVALQIKMINITDSGGNWYAFDAFCIPPIMRHTMDKVIPGSTLGEFCSNAWASKVSYTDLAIGGETEFILLYVDLKIFGDRFANTVNEAGVRPPNLIATGYTVLGENREPDVDIMIQWDTTLYTTRLSSTGIGQSVSTADFLSKVTCGGIESAFTAAYYAEHDSVASTFGFVSIYFQDETNRRYTLNTWCLENPVTAGHEDYTGASPYAYSAGEHDCTAFADHIPVNGIKIADGFTATNPDLAPVLVPPTIFEFPDRTDHGVETEVLAGYFVTTAFFVGTLPDLSEFCWERPAVVPCIAPYGIPGYTGAVCPVTMEPTSDPTSDPTAEPTTATPTTADPTTANPTIPATAEPTATDTAPCVPINTCFEEQSNAFSATSLMWSCESGGVVKKTSFDDTGCGGFPQVSTVNSDGGTGRTGSSLHGGVQTSGSSSGVVLTDYLQGTDCPVLDASPSSCTDYMVFRRYGDATYLTDTQEGIPYEDIGSDCVNKKNYLYSTFAVPIGCGLQPSVGSNEWNCNATHIWWLHYGDDTCGADGGSFQAAQSDVFEINTCGLFRDEWNYYFEEICGCDRPCSDVYTADPTTAAPTTAAPTTVAPTTATPTLSPLPTDTATASPTSVSPTTADPTTADPTTADPTTADPTTAADATTTDATDTTDATADPTATGVDDDDDEDENVAGAELVEADGGADARTWASVAIVIGVFLASLAGLFLVVFCWRKRKGADAADQSDAAAGDLLQDSTHNYLLNRNASLDLKLLGYLVIVVQVVCYVILLVAVWGDAGKHNVPVEVDHGYCTDEGNLSSNVAISGLYCEVNRPQDNMVAIIAGLLIVMSFVAPDVFAGLRLFKHHMMVSFLLLVESGIAVLVATLLIFETAEQGAVQVMAAGVSVIFIHDIDEKIKAAVDQIAQRWKCCCCCRNHCPTSNLFLLVAYFLGGFTINILVGFIVYCSANGCNY